VGITKAALHYHFATKADLGEALIGRYAARFGEALAAIDAGTPAAPAKLHGYAELYARVLRNQRMCLCGMLAAEYPTLPGAMQASVVGFFDQNEAWLRDVLELGRGDGSLHFTGSSRDVARMIISCLEGAMLVTRPYGDIPRFQDAAASLITSLTSPSVIRR
jgi:TetR/AcrR family transcriptional repressor of nem operon